MANSTTVYRIDNPGIDAQLFEAVHSDVSARLALADMDDDQVEDLIVEQVKRFMPGAASEEIDRASRVIGDDFLRYGPLQPLMEDPIVNEIMVCGGGRDKATGKFGRPKVYVEVAGVNYPATNVALDTEERSMKLVSQIARIAGRRCDEANPLMDAQLPDGSRVNAVHHSIAIDGQTLNIRKFKRDTHTPEQLVSGGTSSPAMMEFLRACVQARVSMVVSGGTGSGKTTLLNALSTFIPDNEHIVVVEDTAELQLKHPHVDRLQARPANAEGEGRVTMHNLVVNTLRMKPDRIIVGECRSDETIEMLQAMQTGHDGSLTTVHATSATGVFSRIETMVKSGHESLDTNSIKQQIADALDLIVQTKRTKQGLRVIDEIMTVDGFSDGVVSHTTLFKCDPSPDGSQAEFKPCGQQPRRIKQKLIDMGVRYDPNWFFGEGAY